MNSGLDWSVEYSTQVKKILFRLRKEQPKIYEAVANLSKDIEKYGPIRKNWHNFSPLHKQKDIPNDAYHCHLKKGKPTYVACWKIEDKKVKLVEVYYVGTHENAPY